MQRGTKCSVQSHNSNDVYLRQRKVLIMRLWLHQHGTSQSQFTKKNKDSNPILHREKNVVQLNLRHSKESMRPRYLKLLFSGKRMGNLRRNCTHPLISRTASDSPRLLFGPLLLPPRSFSCCAEQLPTASAWRLATMPPLPSGNGRRGTNGRRCAADDGALSGGGASWCAAQCGPPDFNLTARTNGESGVLPHALPRPLRLRRHTFFPPKNSKIKKS
jgi:hypothetical protein